MTRLVLLVLLFLNNIATAEKGGAILFLLDLCFLILLDFGFIESLF